MKYSTEWLKSKHEKGEQLDYLFFWGHTQKVNDVIDKSCFSQWWVAPFVDEGIQYSTAEHWMMAKKAVLFNDLETHELIVNNKNPAEAKQLGRTVKNFDTALWTTQSYEIVVEGNFHKFSQNSNLKEFLLQTGEAILVEASPVDNIWGIGLAADNRAVYDPFKWKGTNLLGFALMQVRDQLKV